jgi:hypothetical protein
MRVIWSREIRAKNARVDFWKNARLWRLTWFGSSKWNVLAPRHTQWMSAGEINSHHPRNGDGLGLFLKTVQNVLSQGMRKAVIFNSLEKIFTSILFVLLPTRRRCLPWAGLIADFLLILAIIDLLHQLLRTSTPVRKTESKIAWTTWHIFVYQLSRKRTWIPGYMNADQISSLRPEGKDSQQCAIQGSILEIWEK